MALIKCKECEKEISTTAENCPHCGYRTSHGKSVTETKTLLVQLVIWVALIIVGIVLFFGSLRPLSELVEEWESCKNWYYYKDNNFLEFVSIEEQEAVLWKFVGGLCFIIGSALNMLAIKKKTASIKGNGFDLESSATVTATSAFDVQRIPGWKRVEMENEAKQKQEQEQG